MNDVARPGELTMHWIPVVDEFGRTHMEAQWSVEPTSHAPVAGTHAA